MKSFKTWMEGKVPTAKQLMQYCDNEECYEIAALVAKKFPVLEQDAGFFVMKNGKPADHAWLKAPDGTIIDPTHSQFDPKVPLLFAKPGTAIHKRFYSWKLHHAPNCLHKLLGVSYECGLTATGECDYFGPHSAKNT